MNNKIRFDMHTHSKNSHDSVCEVSAMADMAKKRGLSGFAVTDHCDIEYFDTMDIRGMTDASFKDAMRLNEQSDLIVLRGIEIGEATWHKDVADEILSSYNFDVVIGSVHAVKFAGYEKPYSQIDFSEMGIETTEKYLSQYFDDVLEMLGEIDFDILAHLTCPFRYVNDKYGMGIDCRKYEDKIKRILQEVISRRIALEINTSCVYDGSGYCEFMPEEWIIQMYKDMGGYLITTGSDAHIAENSANSFDTLYDLLKDIGFEYTYYYRDRTPIKCAID